MLLQRRRGDLAVVLATGGGKTVVVIGPCLYEEGVTLWVSPLRVLLRETDMRLKNANVKVGGHERSRGRSWTRSTGCAGTSWALGVRRVIASLTPAQELNRVVVDEAHIAGPSRELPRMHGAAEERV